MNLQPLSPFKLTARVSALALTLLAAWALIAGVQPKAITSFHSSDRAAPPPISDSERHVTIQVTRA